MSPVHVIVGEDARAETMWASAFTGAVDLYRFPRNVDAFERLTAAEAPVDLVVLTPAQRGPFNLTADQFIARVLEGPLGVSRFLANLHVIVVGQPVTRSHPRVMAVSTLDAAIRLVKFGEVERAPRPEAPAIPVAHEAVEQPRSTDDVMAGILGDLPFSGSVISRIWDAPGREVAPPQPERADAKALASTPDVVGGGPARIMPQALATGFDDGGVQQPAPMQPAQLFARTTAAGFMVPAATVPAAHAAPVMGGGDVASVGAPGEAIEVATGTLQPARQYQLAQAGYRGPAVRAGQVHGAGYDVGGQPVPPALASQVQAMVYNGVQVGNPHDPLLVWSSTGRVEAAAPGAAPGATQPAAPATMPAAPVAQPQAPRIVPIEPPAGAYGAPAPQIAADPFLARAEQRGGDVQFG